MDSLQCRLRDLILLLFVSRSRSSIKAAPIRSARCVDSGREGLVRTLGEPSTEFCCDLEQDTSL